MSALRFVLKVCFVIFVVLLIIIVALIFLTGGIDSKRTKCAIEYSGLSSIMKIGEVFNRYFEHNNQLPQHLNWCDRLMEYYEEEYLVKKNLFRIPQLGTAEFHFAFNKNLSLLTKESLSGDLVLVFEADGELNLSGGPELLKKEHAKDRHFSVENRYVYILFLDGTIAKYRLHDGAIALAKKVVYEVSDSNKFFYAYEEEKAFLNYYKKDETPYSPLKWEPGGELKGSGSN